jgi:hypothetical protein
MSESELPQASRNPALRASDADRERLVDELEKHTIAGRLTTEEFEQRTEQAYAAKTMGELDALHRDLPAVPFAQTISFGRRRWDLTKQMMQETGGSLGLFFVCTVIWAASGANGSFWPVWTLVIVAISLVRNVWALYGPGADLDAVEADLDARRQRRREQAQQRHSG